MVIVPQVIRQDRQRWTRNRAAVGGPDAALSMSVVGGQRS